MLKSVGGVACLASWLCSVSATTAATLGNRPVHVEGIIDCGDWLTARDRKTSVALEHYVLGILNGLSIGTDTEF